MGPVTDEDRKRLDGCAVVASISGGKDSAAMSLWLTENGIEHRRVFADTGWEHPVTYEYLRGPLTKAIGPIEEVRGKRLMAELVRHRKMFPSRLRRFCTQELKVRPLARFMRAIDGDVVNAVGIRAAESAARSKLPAWEHQADFDADVWRPLLDWTEQDVIEIHQRHGLAPNPLYLRGAERVGCWPCIFSRKREIALVADLTPERIEEIATLEAELGDGAISRDRKCRREARGKLIVALEMRHQWSWGRDALRRVDLHIQARKAISRLRKSPANRPTFFHPKGHDPERGDFVPIERVVEWARTSRGGRQMLLLDTEPAGCMRWGLCESHGDAA